MEKSNGSIKAIVGIGNPDDQYADTYHNIGIQAVTKWIQERNLTIETPSRKRFQYAKTSNRVYAISTTYMNESGLAIRELLDYASLTPNVIAIVHDDADMTIGTWKISYGQSSGGHNGIESIIATLNTDQFWRIKIGIRPTHELFRRKASSFVLKTIPKKTVPVFEDVFKKIDATINVN